MCKINGKLLRWVIKLILIVQIDTNCKIRLAGSWSINLKTFESIIINDTLAEGLMIYASLYFTFAFGNLIGKQFGFRDHYKFSYSGLSGPIAIMAYNIFFDHSNISREAELTVKRFYDVITFFWAIYLSGSVGFVWVEQLWDHVLASDSHVSGKLFPSMSIKWGLGVAAYLIFSMERYCMDCGLVCFRHCCEIGNNAAGCIFCQ